MCASATYKAKAHRISKHSDPTGILSPIRLYIGRKTPHSVRAITRHLRHAVMAGMPKDRILNFMSVDELRSWAIGVRDQSTRAA